MKLYVDACVRTVPGKFIYSWFAFHNITFDTRFTIERVIGSQKQVKRIITDSYLISCIKNDYQKFKKSKLTYDKFFGKNIIFVTKIKNSFRIKDGNLTHDNLFVWNPIRNSKDVDLINYRVPISKLSSLNPIKMNICNIPKLFNINDPFDDILDLEIHHNLAIDFFATDGSKHWRSPDLPGFKAGNVDLRIKIAKDSNEKTYWIPPMSESPTKYQCTKYPGKCRFEAVDNANLVRHLKTCIDETKLVTKKVFSYLDFVVRLPYRFFLSEF